MKALIVDDERLARMGLRRLLRAHLDIDVVAEADSVDAAEAALLCHQPDVIFLDVAMPGGSGFDLLLRRRVLERVVFVTAYDEHAVRAFEVNALDYLLKPVEPERLALTVARLRAPAPMAGPDRICVIDRGSTHVIATDDILMVCAERDQTKLVLRHGPPLLARATLSRWETRLGAAFVRVHRSTLVSVADVVRLEPSESSTYRLYLRGHPQPVAVSRALIGAVRAALHDPSA